jgi:type I restriction enzyme S subunit
MTSSIVAQLNQIVIDKSDWTPVKFGDVAYEPKESVKDALKEGIEHVVGLEHIESEDIHLRRFNSIEESTTFSKKFSPGDVLFGRRRAYLKKAARADFTGICSGDIIVMRAKDNLLPALLPFIVNNENFFDWAITHSAGGLSPRCKFKDLANYEFLLPPKAQQAEIAELLWAMDEVIQKDVLLIESAETQLDTEIEQTLHGEALAGKTINQVLTILSSRAEIVTLSECGEIQKGKGIPKSDVVKSGLPCVRYGELYTRHHRLIRTCTSFIGESAASRAFRLKKNDVLFAGSGETITEIGKSAAFTSDAETYAGSDIVIFRPHQMDGVYLGYLMNSQLVRQQLNKYGTGATVMHIYKSDLEKIKIPAIDFDEQVEIGKMLEGMASNVDAVRQKIEASQSLQKSLVNQVF